MKPKRPAPEARGKVRREGSREGPCAETPPRSITNGDEEDSIIEIQNRQRTRRLDLPLLRRIARHVVCREFEAVRFTLCFHLVDASEMAKVNEQFLQHPGSTDVITFDYTGQSDPNALSGEIFISIPDAISQSGKFKTTWQSETIRYLIHGLLHLRGYDDLEASARKIMKREENRLVKSVSAAFPIADIGRG